MTTNALAEKLQKIFIEEVYGTPNIDNDELGIKHCIRAILIDDPLHWLRGDYQREQEGWFRPEDLSYANGSLKKEDAPHWDVKADGSQIMHCWGPMNFYFYNIEELSQEESNKLKEEKIIKEIEKTKREHALSILTEKLVQKMPSLNYLFTGDLEINYGIHLKEIKRGMHMHMPYKPRYGSIGWVANQVMGWGSNLGWDVTLDGKIVCCRVHYDDYINFEVELLSDEQIETYKLKYQQTDKTLINRLATLTEMFEKKLITESEFQQKKTEILNEV
jgi:hypothetical protein